MDWMSGHRSGVLLWTIVLVVLVVAVAAAWIYWGWSSAKADTALGAALDTYSAPLAQPGAPPMSGVYATSADRSKAANQQFLAIAHQYWWLSEGAKAHYFAGVTYVELGNNSAAESELKTAAGAWS